MDVITSSPNTAATSFTSANTAAYKVGNVLAIDQELFFVTAVGATSITVSRGWRGSTAASHTSGAAVLFNPRFGPAEILDALNEGLRALWPFFFKRISDETITTTADTQADYALPTSFGESGFVTHMEMLFPGLSNDGWRPYRWFRHFESSSVRTISLIRIPPVGTKLRLIGITSFTTDLTYGGNTDTGLKDPGVAALIIYAQHYLTLISESQRLNSNGSVNLGAGANPMGANQQLSQYHLTRFQNWCQQHGQRYPTWRTRRRI